MEKTNLAEQAYSLLKQAYEDSLIYGAGFIRVKNNKMENISPQQFEKEMLFIVENMYRGVTKDIE